MPLDPDPLGPLTILPESGERPPCLRCETLRGLVGAAATLLEAAAALSVVMPSGDLAGMLRRAASDALALADEADAL